MFYFITKNSFPKQMRTSSKFFLYKSDIIYSYIVWSDLIYPNLVDISNPIQCDLIQLDTRSHAFEQLYNFTSEILSKNNYIVNQ